MKRPNKTFEYLLLIVTVIAMTACATGVAVSREHEAEMFAAILRDDCRRVVQLLEKGVSANVVSQKGIPALVAAAENITCVKALVAQGADVNIRSTGGLTPLGAAALIGVDGVVAFLIASGADINATDDDGETALSFACQLGREQTVSQRVIGVNSPQPTLSRLTR